MPRFSISASTSLRDSGFDVARFLDSTYAILPPFERKKAPAATCVDRRGSVASPMSAGILHAVRTERGYPRGVLLRPLAALSAVAAAVLLASASHAAPSVGGPKYVAPAGSGALFLVSGHGYGHGVGMGQWGAQGYALQGYTYQQILSAYYPGTTSGQTNTSTIRVLLASGKSKLTISSKKPFTVEDGDGFEHTLPAGKTTFGPGLKLAVDGGPKEALTPPLTFAPASGSNLTLGRAYRGRIVVDVPSEKLRAINVLPLEQYLYGVVPAEMPSTWLDAALAAQAVAARSYALANKQAAAPFDVYADGRSQAYLGVSAETPAATAAVDETAGEVLLYGGHVADTLFSSSTGGWTPKASPKSNPRSKAASATRCSSPAKAMSSRAACCRSCTRGSSPPAAPSASTARSISMISAAS